MERSIVQSRRRSTSGQIRIRSDPNRVAGSNEWVSLSAAAARRSRRAARRRDATVLGERPGQARHFGRGLSARTRRGSPPAVSARRGARRQSIASAAPRTDRAPRRGSDRSHRLGHRDLRPVRPGTRFGPAGRGGNSSRCAPQRRAARHGGGPDSRAGPTSGTRRETRRAPRRPNRWAESRAAARGRARGAARPHFVREIVQRSNSSMGRFLGRCRFCLLVSPSRWLAHRRSRMDREMRQGHCKLPR